MNADMKFEGTESGNAFTDPQARACTRIQVCHPGGSGSPIGEGRSGPFTLVNPVERWGAISSSRPRPVTAVGCRGALQLGAQMPKCSARGGSLHREDSIYEKHSLPFSLADRNSRPSWEINRYRREATGVIRWP